MQELINKRSINAKYFLNDDGTYTAHVGLAPIHYINDDNQFDDIDLNIMPEQAWEFEYSVKKNNFHAYFNDSTDINNYTLASFEIKNRNGVFRWINYKLYGATPTANTINGNTIKYTEVFSNIDLEYVVRVDKLKENIILKQPVSNFSYTFTLKMSEGLRIEQQTDGSIFFIDTDTEEVLWKIDKPYAEDSNSLKTENVNYALGKQTYDGVEYDAITVSVNDNEFLNNAIYPLIIDPTTTFPTTANANDGYGRMDSTGYYINFYDITNLIVGYDNIQIYTFNTFLRFPNISIPKSSTISSAYIKMCGANVNSSTKSAYIYYVNADNPSAPTDITTFNNLSLTSSVAWSLPSTSTGVAISSPDIKTTIQTLVNRSGWASGNAMLFVIKNNDTNNIIKQFYSANNGNYIPSIEITYTASNTAPTQPGAFVSPTETMLLINQTHRLEWGASTDANGDTITYEVENSTDGGTTYSAWYTTSNVYVDFTPNAIATRKFRVRAKDSVGAYSGYTYSITYTIYSDKTQLGTYKLMGKNGILEIPVYDPNTSMSGKNMLRTFLSDGTVACFELQDTDGTEIIKVMGKTKIKGVKI